MNMTHVLKLSKKIPKAERTDVIQVDGYFQSCAMEFAERLDCCKSGDRRFEAGCDLFSHGEKRDAIYCLADGWVALYSLLEDGSRQILHFALPGAVLAFVPGQIMTYGALALTDAVVAVVRYNSLYALLDGFPELGMQLAWLVARDRGLAYDRLASVGRHSARERVAHLLLELFIRCRMQWPGHRIEEMQLPLTQEHIGDATGLTGIHVNRVLRDLRNDRILEFHYRRLRILDPDKLIDVAGVDPHVALSWIRNEVSGAPAAHHQRAQDGVTASRMTRGRRPRPPVPLLGRRTCEGLHTGAREAE
jgi:CRP-like cAMP-binding protein